MKTLIAIFVMAAAMFAQDATVTRPQPYVAGGIQLSNSGVQNASPVYTVGVKWEPRFLLTDVYGQYNSARKTNDNTIDNFKGHTRRLEGTAFYKLNQKWFFGAGYAWSQLSTTNYSKSGYHPELGGGYTWRPVRLQLLYVLRGNDWQNGVQGMKTTFFAPMSSKHFFVRGDVAVYRMHDTVTDPADLSTSAMERSHHHFFEDVRLQLGWRF